MLNYVNMSKLTVQQVWLKLNHQIYDPKGQSVDLYDLCDPRREDASYL